MDKLLTPDASRKMVNIYGKMRDWSADCLDLSVCHGVCCTDSATSTYIEFAYMIDFLAHNNVPESKIRDMLSKQRERQEFFALDGSIHRRCQFFSENGDGCLVYSARPYVCRSYRRYANDGKYGLCKPIEIAEAVDEIKFVRQLARLNRSVVPKGHKGEWELIEKDIEFWAEQVLG